MLQKTFIFTTLLKFSIETSYHIQRIYNPNSARLWGYHTQKEDPFIKLSYVSKHLEEGYPGNLTVNVTYKLVNNALQIIHEAITDRSTVVNLTNHSYFKLDDSPFVDNNELQLNCPTTLETDKQLLPTGNQIPVRGTENDFLLSREIGIQRLDTPFVKDMGSEKVGELYSPKSGISMKVYTNQPAVIVYTPLDFHGISTLFEFYLSYGKNKYTVKHLNLKKKLSFLTQKHLVILIRNIMRRYLYRVFYQRI